MNIDSDARWHVLTPFDVSEVIELKEAAAKAGKTPRTISNWCEAYGLGRRIGREWCVSKVALAMYLDGDLPALTAYLSGDRESDRVVQYFFRFNLKIPKH
jgi:hypothetical protein